MLARTDLVAGLSESIKSAYNKKEKRKKKKKKKPICALI